MKKLISLLLSAALLCGAAGAYPNVGGQMQASPKAVQADLTQQLSALGLPAPHVTGSGDTDCTSTLPGGISLFVSGTGATVRTIAARLDLAGDTALAASQDFGAVCGAITKLTAPNAPPDAVSAALRLEDTAVHTQGGDNLRTYYANQTLLCYEVAPKSVRFTAIAYPSSGGIQLCVNDSFLALKVPPKIVDGRTLVPVRGIFEHLGATVAWDDKTRTATMTKGDTVVVVSIGSTTATVNGAPQTLEVPAQLSAPTGDASTLVPVRFISEALGAYVGWNDTPPTVIISAR